MYSEGTKGRNLCSKEQFSKGNMSITIKESLEHVCNVLAYFGIEYITADVLRRGKNERKVKRRKVIIKYCFLINDLCLLYFFEFKRKFKPTYKEYVEKEISKAEQKYIRDGKGTGKRDLSEKRQISEGESGCGGEEEDEEEYAFEQLGEDVNYFDDFFLISPVVILVLEYFQYPRLYQLIKCNFQMAKELLLCIGFLIDCTRLFEYYDKGQPFYETFFKGMCRGSNNKGTSKFTETISNGKRDETVENNELYHFINEAMLILSNRPYDLEIFQYKHFYNFLEILKRCSKEGIEGTKPTKWEEKTKENRQGERWQIGHSNKGQLASGGRGGDNMLWKKENMKSGKMHNEEQGERIEKKEKNRQWKEDYMGEIVKEDERKGEQHNEEGEEEESFDRDMKKKDEDNFTLNEYITYDYSTYQERFLSNYSRNKIHYDDENNSFYLDDNRSDMYISEVLRNINNSCNKLIQLQNQILLRINQSHSYDKNRLNLFHRFGKIISAYTELHNIVVNCSSNTNNASFILKQPSALDIMTYKKKKKKVDLMNNLLFTVTIDMERERKNIENKLIKSSNLVKEDKKRENIGTSRGKSSAFCLSSVVDTRENDMPWEYLDDINYDILGDKITINEFHILNDTSLYNNILHIYKNGVDFFHYEQLRAVFWLWLQSVFSENMDPDEDPTQANKGGNTTTTTVSFRDINNNQFFYDNVTPPTKTDDLHIHVLSDLNNFEKNYRLLKEYVQEKGCTCGYNKISSREQKHACTDRINSIKKYVNNLHLEFEAFFNYKKRAKDLSDEAFVSFLEEKKKNMIISSNVEKDDYTNLANVVNKHLINIDRILKYDPILNFSKTVEGIKAQNFIRTTVDINEVDDVDWCNMYTHHKTRKSTSTGERGDCGRGNNSNRIINLTTCSSYRIGEDPVTYASTIFKYSDHFISNNDVYTFSDNIYKMGEDFYDFTNEKKKKCTHNFYHVLRKVEKRDLVSPCGRSFPSIQQRVAEGEQQERREVKME
ncbi:conserved Plasmodium protein, unknown function [Plasmodium ovale wallikeri]|uniref:Uncharacterized protein n=1 Tax=Plasmodium ovale wallikeri TaxID=864142 RepID=A0A1A8YGX9_PLAOA|nr:conserved Plasmodium protein, unknown function [Plasmodium ovale wallikeri]